MTNEEEVDYIIRIRQGDPMAFEPLLRENHSRIYNLALHMTGSVEDARDLAQEIFFRAYKSIDSYKGESRFSVWLYRIATNMCIDFLRKRRGEVSLTVADEDGEVVEIDIPDTRFTPETQAEHRELRRAVNRGLQELPDEQRKILVLRGINGLSYNEIGKIMDLPPGTVKSKIFRARSRLTDLLLRSGSLGNFSVPDSSDNQ